ILTTYGVAKKYSNEIGSMGLILRIDGGITSIHPDRQVMNNVTSTFSVEDAVKIGADGIMSMGFVGLEDEDKMIQMLSKNASEADKWGLVFGAEMIPGGFKEESKRTLENIAFSARLGAEYGADFVKTCYSEESNSEEYRTVVENCYRPVLILGGGKSKNARDLFTMIKNAMKSGARGVVMGRNIWNNKNIDKYCRAISMIIHENADVEQALKEL
ncbi:class I fructose-bisphosphate aldolase, partial [Clostridium sp.]